MDENIATNIAGFLLTVLLTGGFIWLCYYFYQKGIQQRLAREEALRKFASHHNFHFEPVPESIDISGSYPDGIVANVISGRLQHSDNRFLICEQEETRDRDRSSHTYKRTIACVEIPDTKLQLIINSKLNNDDTSGGNLAQYRRSQRYKAEGSFSDYFEIYSPRGAEVDVLTLLAPDVLEYILENFSNFDIEVVDNNLFIYAYKILDVTVYGNIIGKIDRLVEELVLRLTDARTHGHGKAISRIGLGHQTSRRLASNWYVTTITGFFLLLAFLLITTFAPARYSDSKLFWYVQELILAVYVLAIIGKGVRETRLKRSYRQNIQRVHKVD